MANTKGRNVFRIGNSPRRQLRSLSIWHYRITLDGMRRSAGVSVTKEQLQTFKEIYFLDYGKRISDAEALDLCTHFFSLIETIYRPLPPDPLDADTPSFGAGKHL